MIINKIKNIHLESFNMTREEFDKRLKELKLEFDENKKALLVNFALSHNTIAVGDIVKDHIGCAKVIKNGTHCTYDGYSEMKYNCIELKKDGTTKKNEAMRWVYQSNIKEVNGEPYNYDIH